MSKAKVTSKGQLTIPADIRRALGIEKGDVLLFELGEGGMVVRKARKPSSVRGTVPAKPGSWKDIRRAAWRTRAESIARSSATPTSS
jgi:AbrB family looped-hinge helix DNA binding protein